MGRKEEQVREMAQRSGTLIRKSQMIVTTSSFSSGIAMLQVISIEHMFKSIVYGARYLRSSSIRGECLAPCSLRLVEMADQV